MDIKEKAWQLRQQGYSYAAIAEELGIAKSTAYKYISEYEKTAETEPESEEETEEKSYDVSSFVEETNTDLEVVSVDKVVEEINSKIIPVEPEIKVKKIEEEKKETVTSKVNLSGNTVLLALAAVVVTGVLIGIYVVYFRKEPEPQVVVKKYKEEVVTKRVNPQTESSYDYLRRYGVDKETVVL